MSTTTTKHVAFETIVQSIPKLDAEERETIEALLDEEFTRTVLERGQEITKLRSENELLSLDEL